MHSIETFDDSGKIIIKEEFSLESSNVAPSLNEIGDEYIKNISGLTNIKTLKIFEYESSNVNNERYTNQFYRISKNGVNWSKWIKLEQTISDFPDVSPDENLNIEIKWIRDGISNTESIRILNYFIEGELERNEQYTSDGNINLMPFEKKIVMSPFIFKVFEITDIEIIPDIKSLNVEIKYRYSQDSTRTWSKWEPFNKENLTTVRINPIRFFQIEYSIENKSKVPVKIVDVNLIGDFQNVNKDYQKSNLFGIRECCSSNQYGYMDADGNFHPNTNLNSASGDNSAGEGNGGICDINTFKSMTDEEKANLYNPYAQNTATKLLEKLSSDSEEVFGHKVTYFATDPDQNGQDHTLNEYQLYNVSCERDLKISIDGNNFPDSQIKMNIFELDLFDSMEAHVTKKQFKEMFGVQRRPSKEDLIYFCQVNRMYQVDHAQQFRNFNNSAVYYKLILKKYNQKSNVKPGSKEVNNELSKLVNNSTIDELFGIEQQQDKKSIANKDQTAPLTKDPIRLDYFADIDKELIENSSTIISKANYDLSSVRYGNVAVSYKNFNPIFKKSDNISLQIWFSINNYLENEIFNFMHFYDEENNLGWKTHLINDKIVTKLNDNIYEWELEPYDFGDPIGLNENTWYCYVLNIDQRQKTIEQYIYKRDVEYEEDAAGLNTTKLKSVYDNKQEIEPVDFVIENNNPLIIASDMKVTNIRLFSDVIPENIHNKVLNQYIIGNDSDYLIFADNATTRLYLPNFYLNE